MLLLETLQVVIGPTGSGKSLFEMLLADYFLLNDDRPIITTLAVDIPRLAEYLQEKYGDKAPSNIAKRIIRIDANDLATFWRCRGIEYDGEYGYTVKKMPRFGSPEWTTAEGLTGVVFLLDEAQVKFKAREFMKNSGEFLDYQPQARKLKDTILAVSPASSLLDKGFRDLANRTIVLQNLYKIKIGMFTAPKKIVANVYLNCPPAHNEIALEKHEFTIDAKGLASCYRTFEGVGVKGIGADIGNVAKGIPWWAIIPAGLVLGFLVWFGLSKGLHAGMNWGLRKMTVSDKSHQAAAANLVPHVAPSPFDPMGSSNVLRFTLPPPPKPQPPEPAAKPPQGRARGFAVLDGVLFLETPLGIQRYTSWTNTGLAIVAGGVEWSISRKDPPPGSGIPGAR